LIKTSNTDYTQHLQKSQVLVKQWTPHHAQAHTPLRGGEREPESIKIKKLKKKKKFSPKEIGQAFIFD
jgi:hypothetical protein